jgi:hypothetical protein
MPEFPKFFRCTPDSGFASLEDAADTGWDLFYSGVIALDALAVGGEVEDDDGYIWERVQ